MLGTAFLFESPSSAAPSRAHHIQILHAKCLNEATIIANVCFNYTPTENRNKEMNGRMKTKKMHVSRVEVEVSGFMASFHRSLHARERPYHQCIVDPYAGSSSLATDALQFRFSFSFLVQPLPSSSMSFLSFTECIIKIYIFLSVSVHWVYTWRKLRKNLESCRASATATAASITHTTLH